MATLKDVAKKANVSLSTASYALNGSPRISKKTKEKVQKAASEIGYVPNGLAKGLKKQHSNIIALFISGYKGPVFGQLTQGIQDVAIEKGYELIVNASHHEHRLLKEKHYDGAIILNYHVGDVLVNEVANNKTPVVVLDRYIEENPHISSVLIDNKQGISLGMDYLFSKGYTKIGFARGAATSFDGEERYRAYQECLKKQEIPFSDDFVYFGDFIKDTVYEEVSKSIKSGTEVPQAIICANDEMALGVIEALVDNGYRVPIDVSVIGFDDIRLSRWADQGLTTIRVPLYEWGRSAAETLFKQLQNEEVAINSRISVEMIKRNSG